MNRYRNLTNNAIKPTTKLVSLPTLLPRRGYALLNLSVLSNLEDRDKKTVFHDPPIPCSGKVPNVNWLIQRSQLYCWNVHP